MSHGASGGATEDQVSMVGTVPERVNKHGEKIEDVVGTGTTHSEGSDAALLAVKARLATPALDEFTKMNPTWPNSIDLRPWLTNIR